MSVTDKPREDCPRCGQKVRPREDGTLGQHWLRRSKFGRVRCALSGRPPANERQGRRVTVSVDAVLPRGVRLAEFETAVRHSVESTVFDGFLLEVTVDEQVAS